MDVRRLLVFFGLAFLILFGWYWIVVKPAVEQQRKWFAQEHENEQRAAKVRAAAGPRIDPDDPPVEAPRPGDAAREVAVEPPPAAEPEVQPRDDKIVLGSLDPNSGYVQRVTLTTRGAAVRQIELNDPLFVELEEPRDPLKIVRTIDNADAGRRRYMTFQTSLPAVDEAAAGGTPDLNDVDWKVERQGASSVTFSYQPRGAGLKLLKRFSIRHYDPSKRDLEEVRQTEAAAYELAMTLSIENVGGGQREVVYRFLGPVGMPLEDKQHARKFSDLKAGLMQDGDLELESLAGADVVDEIDEVLESQPPLGLTEANEKLQKWTISDSPFRYAGIDLQFFAGLVLPGEKAGVSQHVAWLRPALLARGERPEYGELGVVFESKRFELAAGEKLEHTYRLFAGPKRRDLLAAYEAGDIIEFGWFAPFSKGMLWLLERFRAIGLPYGLAIICLTMLVRGAMFPLSKKQALGAKKMKELQPQLQELKKKYADDKQKMTQAQMELFRKANYNPFAGCLPIFLQLPIFIGLYNALYTAVDLRLASFLWVDNLAAPDQLFELPFRVPIVGWTHFNLLPIVTVVLFIIQQKMFMPPPAPDDEQAKMTHRMMNFMMVFMGFLFYHVPAGLCVYFIASSLWGLGERKLLDRVKSTTPSPREAGDTGGTDQPGRPAKPAPQGGNGTHKKKEGFWAKLMDAAESAQAQRREQTKSKTAASTEQPAADGTRRKRGKKSKRR
ncbi:MAG: YidC/Oxa1 family insertase periplasmic-domain containing protein [Planctomycetes bacterium]|nr:YidC/Oxa1 family insertase periplasmic-domain containing protein [Planctomycetota bacterium]